VVKSNGPKSIASFLSCLSILENDAALLYEALAHKVEAPLIKMLLSTIAIDSKKHSVILKGVSESIAKTEIKPKDCEKTLDDIWQVTGAFHKEIKAKEKITDDELPELSERLTVLEGALGEEYHVFVQLKTLELMAKEVRQLYNVNLEQLKRVFSTIIEDETRHREVLGTIKQLISQKEQEKISKNPLARYPKLR
jgi:rubrerythrin